MIFLFITAILFYLYYKYGISYAFGSAQYAKINNNKYNIVTCYVSIIDERNEFISAFLSANLFDTFLEFFDMVHAIIIYAIVRFTPQRFFHHWICWFIVFPFVLPTSIKLGNRYNKYGCIRNHSRRNLDHECYINSIYQGIEIKIQN